MINELAYSVSWWMRRNGLERKDERGIVFFGYSVFCLSESSVDPAIGAPWNMESIPLGSTEFCILPIELFRSIGVTAILPGETIPQGFGF